MTFTPKQLRLVATALRVAAEVWRTDAGETSVSRVREQFEREAVEAEALARTIEVES